jgi:hypothetical protein
MKLLNPCSASDEKNGRAILRYYISATGGVRARSASRSAR